jgi:hypothetical protein
LLRRRSTAATPDNLCTGDPCTIASSIEVTTPCVVDFGSRALVVSGAVHAPIESLVSFTAASIVVSGLIEVSGPGTEHFTAGDIALTATGDVTVVGRLDAFGWRGGTIVLDAGATYAFAGRSRCPGSSMGAA